MRLERNPSYWDQPKPYLDRIVFRVMPEAAAIAAAHEAGELQLSVFTAVPTGDIKRLAGLPGLALNSNAYRGVSLNDCVLQSQLAADKVLRGL